jgi:hypothetical protein
MVPSLVSGSVDLMGRSVPPLELRLEPKPEPKPERHKRTVPSLAIESALLGPLVLL